MEHISLLLSEALTPYQVDVASADTYGACQVTVKNSAGATILQRAVQRWQFDDQRSFTDVVDGLHRDLRVAEGRLEPCMIAAMRSAAQNQAFSANLA